MDEEKNEIEEEKQVAAEPAAKKSMKWLWAVIAVVVLIVVGALAYWLGKNASTDDYGTVTPVASGSIDMLTATAPADDTATTNTDTTANWKTYTNDTYGFSFKYPSDWTLAVDRTSISINSPENQALKNKIDASGLSGEGYGPTIVFNIFASASDYVNYGSPAVKSTKTISEYMSSVALDNTFKETTMGGQKAYEDEEGGFAGSYYNLVCEHNTTVYAAQIVSDKKSLTNSEKTIFSSFQFTK